MARKITEQAISAFLRGENFHLSNTEVRTYMGGLVELTLWGNVIAFYSKHADKNIKFNLCGWNTNITRERLRGLGINITTRRGKIYFDGKEIESRKIYDSGIMAF